VNHRNLCAINQEDQKPCPIEKRHACPKCSSNFDQ
jgi:hypothetical protein